MVRSAEKMWESFSFKERRRSCDCRKCLTLPTIHLRRRGFEEVSPTINQLTRGGGRNVLSWWHSKAFKIYINIKRKFYRPFKVIWIKYSFCTVSILREYRSILLMLFHPSMAMSVGGHVVWRWNISRCHLTFVMVPLPWRYNVSWHCIRKLTILLIRWHITEDL